MPKQHSDPVALTRRVKRSLDRRLLQVRFFPTSWCGDLVFGCALPPSPSYTHTWLTHNSLTHNSQLPHTHTTPSLTHNSLTRNSVTHNFFTHNSWWHRQPSPSHTQLAHTQLVHTQLTHTQLSHTQLTHSQLVHTQLTHRQLPHTQLAHTQLAHTHLHFGVARVALGDINLGFAWHAWYFLMLPSWKILTSRGIAAVLMLSTSKMEESCRKASQVGI